MSPTQTTLVQVLPLAKDLDENKVTPGVLGFVVFAVIGLAVWLLMKSMNKHMNRVDFEEQPAAGGGSAPVGGPDGAGDGGTPGGTSKDVAEATDADEADEDAGSSESTKTAVEEKKTEVTASAAAASSAPASSSAASTASTAASASSSSAKSKG
ncbi:hypothetical protein [Streptomyces diacarni]|uniref:hypothetical protein n=1 Tax=Streptomyces diacarni TaxID=2800381 RepID=UPI001FEA5C51|nr:hypothetical protein [Streptomyces diacarni]